MTKCNEKNRALSAQEHYFLDFIEAHFRRAARIALLQHRVVRRSCNRWRAEAKCGASG